jgi:hypothetical protein
MSREDLSPASELIAALREVSADANAYGAARERVSERLARAAVLGEAPAGAPEPQPPPFVPGRAAGLAGKGVAIAWLVPAFAAGVLAGVAADRAHTRLSAEQVIPTPPPTIVREHPLAAAPSEARATTAQTGSAAPAAEVSTEGRPTAIHASPGDWGAGLAAEQHLLDTARTALAKGEPAAALAPLELHAQRFPKGKLSEEREALSVRVLALLGRDDEARARADGFHRRFPGSLFTPAVDNAVDAISRRNGEGVPNQER